MTRIILAIPLALTACAPITCERVWLDPVTGLYGCERPTGTLAAAVRGEGTDRRDPPAVDRPEPPRDHVTEPDGGSDGIHDHDDDGVEDEHGPTPLGPEPDRQTDPEEHEHWREQRDLYKEWGWK